MKVRVAAPALLLLMLSVSVASGQRAPQGPTQPSQAPWRTIESKEVNLRFRLPPGWQTKPATRNGRPCLEAISPRSTVYFHACSFRSSDLTLDDLLDQTLDDLGVDLDDDAEEERINGLDALVGEATGSFSGRDLGMFLIVAADGDTRYVVYVMTKADLFDANAATMNRIVDSLAPLTTPRR